MKKNNEKQKMLAKLIKTQAIIPGEVTLSSGETANYYIDLRQITLHHLGSALVGEVMLELILAAGFLHIDAVGGLTMGADPVAYAIMHASRNTAIKLNTFVVRKTEKTHGLQRQIEGPSVIKRKVIIVEDTSTTGVSALTAVEAAQKQGAEVLAVAVIVDRDTGARERIQTKGIPYLAAFSLQDLGLDLA